MSYKYKRVLKNFSLKSVLLLLLLCAGINSFAQSPLSGIPGLALWLRADSGVVAVGDSVALWHDLSGGGNDAVATPGSEPTLITAPTLNNKPSILFNGTSDFFTGPQIAAFNNNAGSCGTYIFLVHKSNGAEHTTGTITNTGLFTIGTSQDSSLLWERSVGAGELFVSNQDNADAAQDYIYYSSSMPNTAYPYKIFEVRKTETQTVALYANVVDLTPLGGFPSNSGLVNGFTNSVYNVGWAPGTQNYLNGEIAELIVFTGACLTGAEIAQVETYLGTKYSPTVHIGPRDTTITHGLCALTLTVPAGFTNCQWSNGATTNSISVSTSGTYWVNFKDAFGALQYDTSTVTFPNITLNPTATLCAGDSLELVPNVPSFTNYTFKWSPGNQTTDSIKIGAAGSYKVVVTDALNNSCSVTTNAEVVSVDNFKSTVSLGPAATLCSGNKLALVTPAEPWNRLRFLWSTASTDSLIWINTPATYSVTVTDTIGCSGSASVNVTIAGVAPHVNFTTNPVCQGLPYAPYNNSDSVNVKYAWQFGDGGTDTSRFPSHLYHAAGTFQVQLTVTNSTTGCVNDTVIPVVINALPGAAFQSAIACTGFPYNFINLSAPAPGQTISTYAWNFGDLNNPLNDTSSSQSPSYTYNVVDTFLVTLAVTQANGCSATTSGAIIVESPASAPAITIMQLPADSAILADSVVTFGWQTAAGAEYYDLTISTDPGLGTGDSLYYNIFSNQFTVSLPGNQTYYWRVASVNPCGTTSLSQTNTFTLFNPANLGNVAFWLRADRGIVSNGGSVSKWMDQSPSNDSATATGAAEPTLVNQVPLLNYMPTVKFGNNNVMTGNPIAALGSNGSTNQNSLSIFIVCNADGPLPNGEPGGIFTIGGLNSGMWIERGNGFAFINYYNNDGAANAQSNPPILNQATAMPGGAAYRFELYGVMKSINSFALIDTNGGYDTSNFNGNTIGTFQDSAFSLGHPAGTDPYSNNIPYGYLNGEIAEIIVYNTLLTPAQQAQVNQYIFNKYAPPVNLGPDIVQNYSLCPVTLHTGNRFVSYKWSTGATSDTLIVTQSGKYSVTVQDVFNHISSDSINVTLPYQGSNPDTDFICHNDTGKIVQLINQPQSYTYAWYYGATPTSTFMNLNINSNTIRPFNGGYYYTVITDTGHCSLITQKIPVIIDNFYAAQLLPAYDTICTNGTLIINPSTYVIDSILWLPINDTTSVPAIPNSGVYYLYTTDNHDCKNIDSVNVTTRIAQAPITDFTVANLCLANNTYFTNTSTAIGSDFITSYNWNFGGGIPSTDTTVNGQTSYVLDYGYGNYTVTLKVSTDSGCFGIKTEHITILPSPIVGYIDSANNSLYPYILCAGAGSSAQFTDTSQAVGSYPITERIWKFNGVVNSDSGSTIQYSFPQQGVYTVMLEVVNALGCADSVSQQIDVNPSFVADFGFTNHCLGEPTTFTDLTQSLSVVSRTWNFRENGNGPYAYSPTTQITYGQPGIYDVQLQLENAIGCISTVDKQVKIVEGPIANFTNLISCVGQPYLPMDSSFAYGDTLVEWNWNIGGLISHVPSPAVTFGSTGLQNVSLTVVSSEGCVDSVSKTIEVAPVPTALFAFDPLYGTAPLTVNFSNRSTGATDFTWYFGDGNSYITDSPVINPPAYTYMQDGNYNIVLYAYNQYGCYDSLSRLLTVIPTTLDIAIDAVNTISVTQPDGSQLVTLRAYISNVGSRIITSAQLYATLGGAGIMEQNWSGYLLSGQSILDTFPAQFVVPQGAGNTYVCVTARNVNNGETEVDTINNQSCASLNGAMQLAGPSPNPAINYATLGIILPQAGTVYVAIFDELGQPIVPELSLSLPVGRTDYVIPVARLQGAEYYIRVRYNDDTEVRNFVVR